MDLPLSATAVTTAVGRRVCGWPRRVYLEMNLKSGWDWEGTQSPERPPLAARCKCVGRASRVIAVTPPPCKHRRKRAKDILKHTDGNAARNAIGYVLSLLTVSGWGGGGTARFGARPLVVLKVPIVDRRPSFIQTSLTVDPSDHRRRAMEGSPRDQVTQRNSGPPGEGLWMPGWLGSIELA